MFALKPLHQFLCLGLSALAFHGATLGAAPEDINQAEQLINQGRGAEALPLLLPHETDKAGDARYDYLLGTAWLESNDPARASLTLERSIQSDPNHAGARLEMGRAYFAMGDYSRAQSEFEALQKLNPPPAAREAIGAYLAEIDKRKTASRTRMSGYLETSLAHDSNINYATSKSTIYVPVFNSDLTLTSDSLAKSDNAGVFAGGAEISHAFSDSVGVFVAADVKYRDFIHRKDNNFGTANLRTGISVGSQRNQLKLVLNGEKLRQNDLPARDSLGGALEWRYLPRPTTALTPFIQHNHMRYRQEANLVNDANQTVAGLSWLEALAGNSAMLFVAGFGGKENAINSRADGDKLLAGARLAIQASALPHMDVYASAGLQRGRYDAENIAFDQTRRDLQTEASAGVVIRAGEQLSFRPSLNYTRNRSNIEINDYRRTELLFTVRYDIR